jgi:aryl-alcohol dehydrogenase
VLQKAFECVKVPGKCGLLGLPQPGAQVALDMQALLTGRTLVGIIEGDSDPQVFIHQLIDLYRAGSFPFDRLVKLYGFDQINEAAHDMETGATIKPVLRMA